MNSKVTLRPASIHDLDTLRRWDELPHVVESDPNSDWEWESELSREPPWREQLVAGRQAILEMFQREFAAAAMVCIVENLFEDGEWAVLEWRDPR